ncbi:MAG: DUF445 domain-containing protein [Spirochaetota bacterium]
MQWIADNVATIGIFLMPLTYGFVGWFTNLAAIKMMFYPLQFRGIKPFLGWQGIVPRKASGLALKSANLLQERVVQIDQFFSKIKPQQINRSLQPILEQHIPNLTASCINSLDQHLREQITTVDEKRIQEKVLSHSLEQMQQITSQLAEDVKKVFNFKGLVLRALAGDNAKLIVDIFQEVGSKEFLFIQRSGWYFGALLGLVQAGLWLLYPYWWTLPMQGIVVGYITNFLALNMIFRPLYEKRYLFFSYQGLFLKRQDEVSKQYARIFAEHVMNPRNILEEILYRRIARTIGETIEADIIALLHTKTKPEEKATLSQVVEQEIGVTKSQAQLETVNFLSQSSQLLEKMMAKAMPIEKMIYERMRALPPEEFEPILRSAFQEDEYILILLGSVLGALVGMGQAVFMLLTM